MGRQPGLILLALSVIVAALLTLTLRGPMRPPRTHAPDPVSAEEKKPYLSPETKTPVAVPPLFPTKFTPLAPGDEGITLASVDIGEILKTD
ncbi:MAG TPA: hypothetical protein QGH10_13440, partial [Armatimonadota bacterium]|nr:hypothetical protein [Armatimonadota bacterium]